MFHLYPLLISFIYSYGYLILLIGTFLEGETITVIAGFLAFQGHLNFLLCVLFAGLGAFAGDQLYFFLGRWKGRNFINRFHFTRQRIQKVHNLLEKYDSLFILGFRFAYGFRTITPLVIGSSKIKSAKYFILNLFGAFIWAFIFVGLGYLFGNATEKILGEIRYIELGILFFLIFLGGGIWLARFVRMRRLRKSPKALA